METGATPPLPEPGYPAQQILGISFFNGTAAEAVDYITTVGGYVVVPAAPALVKLQYDADFREAIIGADLAIADSGLMVILWRLFRGNQIGRLSGLTYLKEIIDRIESHAIGKVLWIVPSTTAQAKAMGWARGKGFSFTEQDFYVAPYYGAIVEDEVLLAFLATRKPRHVVIAIGGGPQEKLGRFLRESLPYRPAIHCIGAALGFLTGDQVAIPEWADRFYLGWLLRLFAQPRIFIPRLARAALLPLLIMRYRQSLPPLKRQEEDRGQRPENR